MKVDILREAATAIVGDREATYGDAELCLNRIARLWTAWLDLEAGAIDAHDVAQMMSLLKKARTQGGIGHKDNYVDDCGYSAIAGEIKCKGEKENYDYPEPPMDE